MDLSNVRNQINDIDQDMKNLFEKRMECSGMVASVKLANNDAVYKPEREIEICNKFKSDRNYLVYIKKIMQISRMYQYKQFIDRGVVDDGYFKWLGAENTEAIKSGGILSIKLNADLDGKAGLTEKEIMSVVADVPLKIADMTYSDRIFQISFVVDSEEDKESAYILTYLLYKETLKKQ